MRHSKPKTSITLYFIQYAVQANGLNDAKLQKIFEIQRQYHEIFVNLQSKVMKMETDYVKESLKIEAFLDEMLQRKESNEVEFKSAKGGFPGSFWETYSSFANTDGGVVIFGVKENLLVNSGFGRGTTYKLNKDYVASSSDLSSSDVASSNNLAGSDLASSSANIQSLNIEQASYLASSDVASSDVASSDEENVMTMITEYCAHQWLSSKDISLKIGRHPTHTRRVIKKMLANGMLEPEYPNQPTHPAQRYRTKK